MKIIVLTYLLLTSSFASSIDLYVHNLAPGEGEIAVAVFDKNHQSSFPDEDQQALFRGFFSQQEVPLKIELPYGDYAISVFQDNNDSGDLDTNLFGIPKEPFGFSNNPIIRLGPPSFQQAMISFSQPNQKIEIRLNR